MLCNDQVFIRFSENYYSKSCFVQTIAATFDCDSNHSDEPSERIKPEDMPAIFSRARCFTDTSRHHMKQNGSRSPRPRFHVTFETNIFMIPENYAAFMKRVQSMYRFLMMVVPWMLPVSSLKIPMLRSGFPRRNDSDGVSCKGGSRPGIYETQRIPPRG